MIFPFNLLDSFLSFFGESLVGSAFSAIANVFGNMGIMLSLTFGALILLRPVTNRLIAPRWRVWIWFVGWYLGYLVAVYNALGKITFLPVSFRSLVIPRTSRYGGEDLMPQFLPEANAAGDYTIAFPGGAELPIHVSSALLGAIGLLWIGSIITVLVWDHRQSKRLRAIGQQGVKMDEEQRAKYGIDRENVVVRLCKDLPTSFVRFGYDDHFGDGSRFVICVQDDLPEERMRLVLLHEMEHLNQYHAWWKSTITAALYLLWWNPILWVAYRLTCRDMELACDEAVMAKLSEDDRREYARTLVDLGAGKPMWGAMTSFGECDAALRVRRVAGWRPRTEVSEALSVLLVIVMVLFFYCGSWDMKLAGELDWLGYVQGPDLLPDLREELGRPDWEIQEVWMRTVEQLLVLDAEGTWYHCSFRSGTSEYLVTFANPLNKEPSLNYYQQLPLWDGAAETS